MPCAGSGAPLPVCDSKHWKRFIAAKLLAEYSERTSATLSHCGHAPDSQDAAHCQIAAGNALGLARVKFPWPSFSNTATSWCSHAVLTSRSCASSPFTSRATICSPPAGADTPKLCAAPAVSWKRIEYCVAVEELLLCISTMAKSGLRSPSKSAMAKTELKAGEEAGER